MYYLAIPERPHVGQYFVLIFGVTCEYLTVTDNIFKSASIKKLLKIEAKHLVNRIFN